jgi:cell wall-associated NlpC family hydrolase
MLLAAGGALAGQPVSLGKRLAGNADRLVGHRSLAEITRRYPDDCSGLVRYVYATSGVALEAGGGDGGSVAAALYQKLRSRGRLRRRTARPGDLVFFRDTWDRNGDGKADDGITHVGLVDAVGRDGTVSFVHRAHQGIVRSHLDLRHPHLRRDGAGLLRNDVLRRAKPGQNAASAGDLLAGFASPGKR